MRRVAPRPDAIVIGAGIVGAACAEALARDGHRVLILEQGVAATGATGAAMGHLVAMDDSPAQLALTSFGLRLWRERRADLPASVERLDAGTLWIAEREEELAALREKRAAYALAGVRAELLDEQALADAEPELREGLAGALRVPDDSVIYPPAAARWLLERAADHGAELREGVRVDAIDGGGVVAAGQSLGAGVIVVAAGCDAPALVAGLPVVPRKGHLIVTDRYPAFCRHQLVELGYLASAHGGTSESVAFNLQPRPTGQMLVGSSRELGARDRSVNHGIVRRMIRRAVHFVPRLAGVHALRVWTGFRPATTDSLPLVGHWPARERVWIAAGHEGLGITTALATASLLADLIAGRPAAIDPAPYSAVRPVQWPAVEAAHA